MQIYVVADMNSPVVNGYEIDKFQKFENGQNSYKMEAILLLKFIRPAQYFLQRVFI